ncbi:hypothetical protein G7Z17_g3624 [Cylindrodendrum hubeiense]|uniref:chitinase n=1 Tax=Cylindrodendrum hubeiense TaxID=595255 RepID=A0A9P5HGK3_9HYPO|nr:hypothetical protein G7Z17_g3624 [Cylindrodendrum hubeiense]
MKKKDPDLKVFIAIGGWTFNDPGPTATIFSDIVASVSYQKTFISSLMSFMSTYGFDGLDLDWQYPQAKDRSGRDADFVNFPKFMARLKKAMDAGGKGLTITLPASYLYLQHFDVKKLADSVDFFNIRSYDLHGAWDQDKEWTGSFLNAHTNLTETELALDLLWRNDIDPDQVVMGLSFYGRSLTAADSSCMKPGCKFDEAGKQGKCTLERGILLNSEIDALVKENNPGIEFYEKEAVKVATWGDQWISFDDAETLKLKIDYAQSRCLGGVMVWAISHDTKDAKYNEALATILDRPTTGGTIEKFQNKQCRWTNCKESCPTGWVNVPRSDGGARNKKHEKMWDETGCGGDGARSFCCPPGEQLPTCGWYGFNNGKCGKGSCPSDMVEIGSSQMYCHNKQNYESACCTTNVKSMKVYGTCEWGAYPDCNSQEDCPGPDENKDTLMAGSPSGSGGGECNVLKNGLGLNMPGTQQRKYCCDASNPDLRIDDCQWFKDVGPVPAGASNSFCRSGCPPDRVRVAVDTLTNVCSAAGLGGMALCCKTSFSDKDDIEVENLKLDAFKSAMESWAKDHAVPRRADLEDVVANSSTSTERAARD